MRSPVRQTEISARRPGCRHFAFGFDEPLFLQTHERRVERAAGDFVESRDDQAFGQATAVIAAFSQHAQQAEFEEPVEPFALRHLIHGR